MASFDDDGNGYRMEAWASRARSGKGYVARVVVRQLPAMDVVFEDESTGDTGVWGVPQQALAAALERGRQFVRIQVMGKATQGPGGHCTPGDV